MAQRDTWASDSAPYHRQSEQKEAAKFLANQCRRFLAEKANSGDVESGIAGWRAVNPLVSKLLNEHAEMKALLERSFTAIANAKDLSGALATNDAFCARKPQEALDAYADEARALLTKIEKE